MSLTINVTPGENFPDNTTVDNPALRRGATPVIELQGTVGADDLSPDAVSAANLPPDAYFYGAATLSGSTILFAANGVLTPTPTAYVAGQTYCFLPNFTCPGGALGVNISGIGVVSLVKNGGQNLLPGDFRANQPVWIQFDGTKMQMAATIAAGGRNEGLTSNTTGGTCAFAATRLILNTQGGTASYAMLSVAVGGVSLSVAGAGGLDTGTAGNNWYHLWAVWNGTTLAGLLSLSATAPTLPTGYFAQCYIAPVNNNTGSLAAQFGMGRTIFFAPVTAFNTTLTSATVYQSLAINLTAPPNALTVRGTAGPSSGTGTAITGIAVAGNSSGIGAQYMIGRTASSGSLDSFNLAGNFECPFLDGAHLSIKATDTTFTYTVDITGYTY